MISLRPPSRLAPVAAGVALALALGLSPAAPVQASTPRKADWAEAVHPERNLFRVTPDLYRSAQLQAGDVELLKSLGVRTVVSLRSFHADDKLLKDSGLKLVRVRINTWNIRDKDTIAALRALREAQKDGPVLLHCWHGADRTGLVIAMHRMVHQRWDKDKALDELLNGGYGYHAMWKNIPRYIRDVDLEKIRRELGLPA